MEYRENKEGIEKRKRRERMREEIKEEKKKRERKEIELGSDSVQVH